MKYYLILLEILSLFISGGIMFLNFRSPVHLRGGKTLEFKVVISHYYHNGLLLDIFALWPLNLILGIVDAVHPLWIIPPLRLVRLVSVWKIMHIFGRFELFFKKYSLLMNILKSALFLCIIWHWTS